MNKKIEVIVTIGPSTNTEEALIKIKDKGVSFVRVNMSHSNIEDLKKFIKLAKKVGIPFIIDTEGSQVRTGDLTTSAVTLKNSQELKIYQDPVEGDETKISLKPKCVISQLEEGDLLYLDFDTVVLKIIDATQIKEGYITAQVLSGGILGKNKGVVIDSVSDKKINLPTLSDKDYESIQIGLEEGIDHIAASFIRSGEAVEKVREATKNRMKIISKIECIDALENLDEIISKTDYLLIDRGDLSKEIVMERIPFTQKIIINKANKLNVKVFVATNLLETMVEKRKPTRAEVHDIISTLMDGASGLTLSAETAIGKHPFECINMLNKLIKHFQQTTSVNEHENKKNNLVDDLVKGNYLLDFNNFSGLTLPHGGKLVNRFYKQNPNEEELKKIPLLEVDENKENDVEQIATGVFSPLEGFMNENDFKSVLNSTTLASGVVWPIPIVLDVKEEDANRIKKGEKIALVNNKQEIFATMNVEEKYVFDKNETAIKVFETSDENHPGVQNIMKMNPILLGGKIELIKRKKTSHKKYELTPRQTRKLFEERGWSKIVGFHTRNVIHRGHEFIQLTTLEKENCDGLFVHPVVGRKKSGDFNAECIIDSYETMMNNFYPNDKVIFGVFSIYSRYAGPREALFTALCRKNFGCSHFIVGRDHTGVGKYYSSTASQDIFDKFPNLGIVPVKFGEIFYSKKIKEYLVDEKATEHREEEKLRISGTQIREMFKKGEMPPDWIMRQEVSQVIMNRVKRGENIFS